jgi:hypothetical protein
MIGVIMIILIVGFSKLYFFKPKNPTHDVQPSPSIQQHSESPNSLNIVEDFPPSYTWQFGGGPNGLLTILIKQCKLYVSDIKTGKTIKIINLRSIAGDDWCSHLLHDLSMSKLVY